VHRLALRIESPAVRQDDFVRRAIVSRKPGRAFVRVDNDYLSNPPFDPACGTLPRLKGYGWRR